MFPAGKMGPAGEGQVAMDCVNTCEDCTNKDTCTTLCSATLITEDPGHKPRVSYVKHEVFGPRGDSVNTHCFNLKWVQHTSQRCYYDQHPINGPPVGFAVKYHKKTGQWVIAHLVCSASCNFGLVLRHLGDYNFSTLLEINMKLLREQYGVEGTVNRPGELDELVCNGGNQTIVEWREACLKASRFPVKPPFLGYAMVFEHIVHSRPGLVAPQPESDASLPDFERLPRDRLETTPAENKNMQFSLTGLRIPSRKKDRAAAAAQPMPSRVNSFNQTPAMYVEFLKKKDTDSDAATSTDTARGKKRQRPAAKKKKKDVVAAGAMDQFIGGGKRDAMDSSQ